MKTLLTIIGLSALCASAAQTTNNPAMDQPSPIAPEPTAWQYAKGELSVESFYTARFSGDFDNAQQGIGVGVGYSLTPNVVVSVRGVSYLDDPQGVNEIQGRIAYRVEVPWILPKNAAAYGFGYGGGNLQSGEGFAGAGGGIQYRFFKNFDFSVESDLRLTTEWEPSIGISGIFGFHF